MLYGNLLSTVIVFYSEAYCRFIVFIQIAYHPTYNCVNSNIDGVRISPVRGYSIDSFGHSESLQLPGLSLS